MSQSTAGRDVGGSVVLHLCLHVVLHIAHSDWNLRLDVNWWGLATLNKTLWCSKEHSQQSSLLQRTVEFTYRPGLRRKNTEPTPICVFNLIVLYTMTIKAFFSVLSILFYPSHNEQTTCKHTPNSLAKHVYVCSAACSPRPRQPCQTLRLARRSENNPFC